MSQLEVFARTEIGCVRERNEDQFLVANLANQERGLKTPSRIHKLHAGGTVLAVCDGMGGAAAGDVASSLAADAIYRVLLEHSPFANIDAAKFALTTALTQANQDILEHVVAHPYRQGMGTTATVALFFGPQLVIGHVGDSRAYLRRGRLFQQLTTDHNIAGQLIASGRMTPEQAHKFAQRNILLQALGVQPQINPELVSTTLRTGDVVLLCSDGLCGVIPDDMVVELMLRYEDPMRCCRSLTEAACAAGGPDNVTVAIARCVGEGLEMPHGREPIVVER